MPFINHRPDLLIDLYNFLDLHFPIPANWPLLPNDLPNDENINTAWNEYWVRFNNDAIPPVALPAIPYEKHPYLDLHPIDITKKRIIIGTFPPISYVRGNAGIDLIGLPNGIARAAGLGNAFEPPHLYFFYGNKASCWNYCPNFPPGEFTILNTQNWLNHYDCTISDIIAYCQRTDIRSSSDSDLCNIIPNTALLRSIMQIDSKIETLLFTSGYFNAVGNISTSSTFKLFTVVLNNIPDLQWGVNDFLGGHLNLGFQHHGLINKAIFKLRVQYKKIDKVFNVICLPSPSGAMNIPMPNHPFAQNWILENGNVPGWTIAFRNHIYNTAFDGDFAALNLLQQQ